MENSCMKPENNRVGASCSDTSPMKDRAQHGSDVDEAIKKQRLQQALARSRAAVGSEHPDTLACMLDLADMLDDLGEYADAEALFRSTLHGCRTQRVGDLVAMRCSDALAQCLVHQGRLEEAGWLYATTVYRWRASVGCSDLQFLSCASMAAMCFMEEAGREPEAERLLRESLAGFRKVLGDRNDTTVACMQSLAMCLFKQSKFDGAVRLYREALAIRRADLGHAHPVTLPGALGLARVLSAMSRHADAEPLFREVMEAYQKLYGSAHTRSVSAVVELAECLLDQREYAEAEPLCRQALVGHRAVSGDQHPATLTCMMKLAHCMYKRGRLAHAETWMREAWRGRREALGEAHPDTLTCAFMIAGLDSDRGRLDRCQPLLQEVIDGRRAALGDEHPHTLDAVRKMAGVVYCRSRDPGTSTTLCRRPRGESYKADRSPPSHAMQEGIDGILYMMLCAERG